MERDALAKSNYGATASTPARPANPPSDADPAATNGEHEPQRGTEPHPGEVGAPRRRRRKPLKDSLGQFNPSLKLRNTGSVARDHLANERTWLAWTRTSLSIASTGVALVQLFALSAQQNSSGSVPPSGVLVGQEIMRVAKPLGAVTIAFGFVVLIIGSTRYFRIQHALTQDFFPPARVSPIVMSVMMTAIVVAVFAIVITLTNDK